MRRGAADSMGFSAPAVNGQVGVNGVLERQSRLTRPRRHTRRLPLAENGLRLTRREKTRETVRHRTARTGAAVWTVLAAAALLRRPLPSPGGATAVAWQRSPAAQCLPPQEA